MKIVLFSLLLGNYPKIIRMTRNWKTKQKNSICDAVRKTSVTWATVYQCIWNDSQVHRRSNKRAAKCKEMMLGVAEFRLKATSTILQKSSLRCGGKSSDIMFGNIEQGLGFVLVASQEPVWQEGKAKEAEVTGITQIVPLAGSCLFVRQGEEKRLTWLFSYHYSYQSWLFKRRKSKSNLFPHTPLFHKEKYFQGLDGGPDHSPPWTQIPLR